MKTTTVALLVALAAPAYAQQWNGGLDRVYRGDHAVLLAQATPVPAPPPVETSPVPPPTDPAPTAGSNAAAAVAGALDTAAALPSGPWTGHFEWALLPAPALWQSVDSPDQVAGLSKLIWHLDKGSQPVINLGISAGIQLEDANGPKGKFVLGPVVQVPGSLLDWSLGTNWGAQWAPDLKTGLLLGYNVVDVKNLHGYPGFVGVGISYPVFGAQAAGK